MIGDELFFEMRLVRAVN